MVPANWVAAADWENFAKASQTQANQRSIFQMKKAVILTTEGKESQANMAEILHLRRQNDGG